MLGLPVWASCLKGKQCGQQYASAVGYIIMPGYYLSYSFSQAMNLGANKYTLI